MKIDRCLWMATGAGVILAGAILGFLARPGAPPLRPSHPGAALYRAHCATCHGMTGRGESWRARLLFLRPGDLTDQAAMGALSDDFLFQIIKHGGASFGEPGMPSFGFHLGDDEIRTLVAYVRALTGAPPGPPR